MKTLLSALTLVAACLLIPGEADAQCHAVTRSRVVREVAAVQAVQAVAVAVPVATVQIASYGHAFGEPEAIRQINAKLDALSAKVDQRPNLAMPNADAPAPKQSQTKTQDVNLASLIKKNCAACHDAGVSKDRGKGFTLVNFGKVVEPSDDMRGELIARLSTKDPAKRMPPGANAMSAEDRLAIIGAFVEAPEVATNK